MESFILSNGIEYADSLIYLLMMIPLGFIVVFVPEQHKKWGFASTLSVMILATFATAIFMAIVQVELLEKASVSLSRQTVPMVTHTNMVADTTVGRCNFTRSTTVWLINGVVVRKKFIDGIYTCIPHKKEL